MANYRRMGRDQAENGRTRQYSAQWNSLAEGKDAEPQITTRAGWFTATTVAVHFLIW